jgi:hypothetical protein
MKLNMDVLVTKSGDIPQINFKLLASLLGAVGCY